MLRLCYLQLLLLTSIMGVMCYCKATYIWCYLNELIIWVEVWECWSVMVRLAFWINNFNYINYIYNVESKSFSSVLEMVGLIWSVSVNISFWLDAIFGFIDEYLSRLESFLSIFLYLFTFVFFFNTYDFPRK